MAAVAIAATTWQGCHTAQTQQLLGEAQGTYYNIIYVDPQQRDLRPAVDSLLDAFDQEASLWVDSSLLRRINAGATDSLSPILEQMLNQSIWMRDYSQGAFNCCVGKLVQAWGFSFAKREEPDEDALQILLQAAHDSIAIANHRLYRANPATELDFNAIAQGYSVDLIAAMFDSMGVNNYLIDVGGEVIAHGKKPDGSPWRVGIERPAADSTSAPQVERAIALRDCSVVTSGNYRKYYEKDGVKYSHTIDPATGRPVQHSLLSVSVVEKESWLADAMATAYMVMGLERAEAFIASHQGQPGTDAVMFIYDSAGTMQCRTTEAFAALETGRKSNKR